MKIKVKGVQVLSITLSNGTNVILQPGIYDLPDDEAVRNLVRKGRVEIVEDDPKKLLIAKLDELMDQAVQSGLITPEKVKEIKSGASARVESMSADEAKQELAKAPESLDFKAPDEPQEQVQEPAPAPLAEPKPAKKKAPKPAVNAPVEVPSIPATPADEEEEWDESEVNPENAK